MGSLAVTYFRMGNHTIIGAGSFHCPVRDGKEWDHTAMAAKHKLSNRKALMKSFSKNRVLMYHCFHKLYFPAFTFW